MNLLLLVATALAGLGLLWIIQTAVLVFHREPLAWPLRYTTKRRGVRLTMSIAIQLTWALVLIVFPFTIGSDPITYFRQRLPLPAPWDKMALATGLMLAAGITAFGIEFALRWLKPFAVHPPAVFRAKLLHRLLTPIPLATVEEAVFRGVLLEQILEALPVGIAWSTLAIVVAAAVFSAVHFIRRSRSDKPRAQPALGLFLAGAVFGVAYLVGDRTLWLPIVSHAIAIAVCETTRLWVVYQGPPRWIGYPECPQCGVIGATCMAAAGLLLIILG